MSKTTKKTKRAKKSTKTTKTKKPSKSPAAAKPAGVNGDGPTMPPAKKRRRELQVQPKPKRVSALDAAVQVLKNAKEPMNAKHLIVAMAEQGLWTSPAGQTPHATLYAAIHREIAAEGKAARFIKTDRGLFTFNAEGSK